MSLPTNQILLGDCVRVLQTLPADFADLVLTDPPYLCNYQDRSGRSVAGDVDPAWLRPAFAAIHRALKPNSVCVSFYGWGATDLFFAAWKAAGFRVVAHLTFVKRYTSATRIVKSQHENAFILAKGYPPVPDYPIGDVIEFQYSQNKLHPTQKPIGALTPIIESFSPRGGIVLDPFAGSGSTCVAARSVGRRYVGIELDPQHQQTAGRRLRDMDAHLAELLGVAPTVPTRATPPALHAVAA